MSVKGIFMSPDLIRSYATPDPAAIISALAGYPKIRKPPEGANGIRKMSN
jgi:hypothetical protein